MSFGSRGEDYSTWGYEEDRGYLYAQIIRNGDDPDNEPRICITPPRYFVRDIDELAEAVAQALAPYEPVPPPVVLVKDWLTRPPSR